MTKYNCQIKSLWQHVRRNHDRRLRNARSQRDRRPQYGENRQLQRGRKSWFGDRGQK